MGKSIIVIPKDCQPGDEFVAVTSSGERVVVVVPEGAKPGSRMTLEDPRVAAMKRKKARPAPGGQRTTSRESNTRRTTSRASTDAASRVTPRRGKAVNGGGSINMNNVPLTEPLSPPKLSSPRRTIPESPHQPNPRRGTSTTTAAARRSATVNNGNRNSRPGLSELKQTCKRLESELTHSERQQRQLEKLSVFLVDSVGNKFEALEVSVAFFRWRYKTARYVWSQIADEATQAAERADRATEIEIQKRTQIEESSHQEISLAQAEATSLKQTISEFEKDLESTTERAKQAEQTNKQLKEQQSLVQAKVVVKWKQYTETSVIREFFWKWRHGGIQGGGSEPKKSFQNGAVGLVRFFGHVEATQTKRMFSRWRTNAFTTMRKEWEQIATQSMQTAEQLHVQLAAQKSRNATDAEAMVAEMNMLRISVVGAETEAEAANREAKLRQAEIALLQFERQRERELWEREREVWEREIEQATAPGPLVKRNSILNAQLLEEDDREFLNKSPDQQSEIRDVKQRLVSPPRRQQQQQQQPPPPPPDDDDDFDQLHHQPSRQRPSQQRQQQPQRNSRGFSNNRRNSRESMISAPRAASRAVRFQ